VTRSRRLLAAAITLTALAGVTGCASTVNLDAAERANDAACADVSVRLPDRLAGQDRRWTDAQATGAWGDPAAVLLSCGLEPPGPTTLPCQTVDGVDWIIDDSDAPRYRVTSFGREPAVEVFLDNDVVSSADVLEALSVPVSLLPTDGSSCLDRPSAAAG
jgi:hypothetical protein